MTADIDIKNGSPRRRERSRDRSSTHRSSRREDRGRERDRDRSPLNSRQSARRIFVSNVPYDFSWQQLKDLFRDKVGEVTYVEMFSDENNKPKGAGIVEFREENLVKKALDTMQRYDVAGRRIVVKDDYGIERDRFGNIVGGSRYGGNVDTNKKELPSLLNSKSILNPDDIDYGNTFGLSRRFLANLNINSPLVNRVFVANLDYKVDNQKLQEVFRLAGKVTNVEVYRDKEGNSRGIGVVEFEHPVESVQAISMLNNQQLYDRFITVRMDRATDTLFSRLPEGLKGIGSGLGNNGEALVNVALNLAISSLESNLGSGSNKELPHASLGSNAAATNSAAAMSTLLQTLAPLQSLTNVLTSATTPNSLIGSDLSGLTNPILNSLTQNSTLAALATNPLLNAASTIGGSASTNSNTVSTSGDTGGQFSRNREYKSAPLFDNNNKGSEHSNSIYNSVNNGSQQTTGPEPLMSSRKPTHITDTIFVSNLQVGTNWHLLRERFNHFSVKYADLKPNGTGIIRFSSDWEAERALKMIDQSYIDGRRIDARFY